VDYFFFKIERVPVLFEQACMIHSYGGSISMTYYLQVPNFCTI